MKLYVYPPFHLQSDTHAAKGAAVTEESALLAIVGKYKMSTEEIQG